MKVTKALKYSGKLTLKPYWTGGLASDNIWDEEQFGVQIF